MSATREPAVESAPAAPSPIVSAEERAPRAGLEWPFADGRRPTALSLDGGTILLAFERSPAGEAAALVADALATRHRASVRVLSVIDASPVPIPPPLDLAVGMAAERGEGPLHVFERDEVRRALSGVLAHPVDWTTIVDVGLPAETIARRSAPPDVALTVMGLRKHGRLDRAVHDETTLSVMRRAHGPVLGITAGTTTLPTRGLVAMDFSRASVRAAMSAAQIMSGGGVLTLAYVELPVPYPPGHGEAVVHAMGIDSAFERLSRALATDVLRIDRIVLHMDTPGAISERLLEYGASHGAELIAAGSARHGRLDRILLGSVSAEIVRCGWYSTLIVPPGEP